MLSYFNWSLNMFWTISNYIHATLNGAICFCLHLLLDGELIQNSSTGFINHKGITTLSLLFLYFSSYSKTKKQQICQTWYILISILALAFSGVKQKKLLIISSNKFDMISFVLTFLGLSFAAKLIIGMSTYWNQL